MTLPRTPEPEELMDEEQQAVAYARALFDESNELFVSLCSGLRPAGFTGRIIDLGCGPADVTIRFARRYPQARIDAVDGAPVMLRLADEAIGQAKLSDRISTAIHHLPDQRLPKGGYDAVLSNSLLHHMRDPDQFWQTVRHCAAPGAAVVVMDLLRPASEGDLQSLVDRYADDAPAVLRRDFTASLRAAYRLDEVQEQLQRVGLTDLEVEQVSNRHLAVRGLLA